MEKVDFGGKILSLSLSLSLGSHEICKGRGHDIFCVSFVMHASLNLEILVTRVNQACLEPWTHKCCHFAIQAWFFSKLKGFPRRRDAYRRFELSLL